MRPEEMTGRLLVALGATCVTLAAASPFSPAGRRASTSRRQTAGSDPDVPRDRRPAPVGALPDLYVPRRELAAQAPMLAAAGYEAVTLGLVLDAWHGRATLPPARSSSPSTTATAARSRRRGRSFATRRWPGVLNLDLSNLTPSWGVGRAGSGGRWPLVGGSMARR